MAPTYDAIVIGAGAAGLAAARELARAGLAVLVLEARDRIGGRIWSLAPPGLSVPVELGAEFIHGRPRATFRLLRQVERRAVPAPFVRWVAREGVLERAEADHFAAVRAALARELPALERRDVAFEALLGRLRRRGLPEAACAFARMRVQGYEAADPARASARAIAESWSAESGAHAGHYRPQGGYGALAAALGAELRRDGGRLRLATAVRTVRWRRGSVEVEAISRGKALRARAARAVVTLPLGVLRLAPHARGAVRFVPALADKRAALAGLACGATLKAVLRFGTAFWEGLDGGRYRDATFFHAPEAPFPTFWTALPERAPLLTAWAGGPRAERLSGLPRTRLIALALSSLATIFGRRTLPASRLEAAWVHDWQRDPYARCGYSYVAVGGYGARRALAAPLEDTLFFAGEATDDEGEATTAAGAFASGARAAREILAAR